MIGARESLRCGAGCVPLSNAWTVCVVHHPCQAETPLSDTCLSIEIGSFCKRRHICAQTRTWVGTGKSRKGTGDLSGLAWALRAMIVHHLVHPLHCHSLVCTLVGTGKSRKGTGDLSGLARALWSMIVQHLVHPLQCESLVCLCSFARRCYVESLRCDVAICRRRCRPRSSRSASSCALAHLELSEQ